MGVHCDTKEKQAEQVAPNNQPLCGYSVNDGIDKELSSVSYVSVDNVMARILKLGRGALLAKMDIKQAYRNVPVYPEDRLYWECAGRARYTWTPLSLLD